MTLNDIIQAAQGGQGVNNIASQFGLSPDQAQAAIQAAMPAFSQGLQRVGQDPDALGGILSHLANGAHQGAYVDPSQAATTGAQAGGDVLGQIFGSPQITSQISQHVSEASGVSPEIIQQMMPMLASILMGGLSHSMNSQGLGGVLGQLANAAASPGGLGQVVAGAGAEGQSGGGLGGLIGSVLGGLMGGQTATAAAGQSASLQNGLSSLTNMFQAGVATPAAHEQGINNILSSLSGQFSQGAG
jgi:hypothetical protein